MSALTGTGRSQANAFLPTRDHVLISGSAPDRHVGKDNAELRDVVEGDGHGSISSAARRRDAEWNALRIARER